MSIQAALDRYKVALSLHLFSINNLNRNDTNEYKIRKGIRNSHKDMAQLMATLSSFPAQPVKETMREQRSPMRGEKAVRTEGERIAQVGLSG